MELRPQVGHLKKNQNFRRLFKWLVLSFCSIFLSLPFFGIASSVHASSVTTSPASPVDEGTNVDLIMTGTTMNSSCNFGWSCLVRFAGVTSCFAGSGEDPYIVTMNSVVAGSYDHFDYWQDTSGNTCAGVSTGGTITGSPATDDVFVVNTIGGGGGSSSTEVFSPSMLDAERTIALGAAFLVMITFGWVGYKASSV